MLFVCGTYYLFALGFVAVSVELGDWFLLRVLALLSTLPVFLVFVCLAKGLFRVERARKEFRIEVFEEEQPRLFDFIRRVCAETGAEHPNHVYVDHAVNASALPDGTSLGSTGKSLQIGLGLVNACNVTEFKAVLAHELGHFTQTGMKLGGFIHQALRIGEHVVYRRDGFDRFLAAWSRRTFLIAWPAWIVRGLLWLARAILGWYFQGAYRSYLALKRQMELHADLVAVSVTGSDAPVQMLERCELAEACFNQSVCDLKVAMDHDLYTTDLFYHLSAAMLCQATDTPATPLMEMWATHPSNHDRERNARSRYVGTVFDERSAWLLFDNAAELRERVTAKFYRYYFKIAKDIIRAAPEEVQGFIDDEHADRHVEADFDGEELGIHHQRALQMDGEFAAELSRRHEFHRALQQIRGELQKQGEPIRAAVIFLNAHDEAEWSEQACPEVVKTFRTAYAAMHAALIAADALTLPALTNLAPGRSLRTTILTSDLIEPLDERDGLLPLSSVLEFLAQFRDTKEKVDRIHFKSLAGIRALQKRIGAE
jgi:Zn-dependent protease with chaperone function